MTNKGDDSEVISKRFLDWLTGVSAIATILTTIFGLVGDNETAKVWAFGAAIVLALTSSGIYFYQRRRAAKLRISESLEPLSATAALRGLLPFEEGDDLPGRGRDVQDIHTLVSSSTFRFGVLWGESGCGKTSLLRAGLVPRLRKENYLPLYIPKPTQDPQEAIRVALAKELGGSTKKSDKDLKSQLKAAAPKGKKVVILVDQFEEFFITNRTASSRAGFIKWLGSVVSDDTLPIAFLIGIRGDFFVQLQNFAPQIPEPTSTRSTYQLQNFDLEQAKQIFSAAAKADGLQFEPELIHAVIKELETEDFVRPAELQVVGTRLKRKNITRSTQYEALGGARGILSSYINDEIKQSANEQVARLVLRLMCADAAETKSPTDLSLDDIVHGISGTEGKIPSNRPEEVQTILKRFVDARVLIHTDEDKYNLAHDYLAPYVRTATEGTETNTERANRMMKRYIAEFKEDSRTRIPFGRVQWIQKHASNDVKSGGNARELIKKSKQTFYGIASIPLVLITSLYLFLFSSYYFGIEGSNIVIRSGHPKLQFFPGFNRVVIRTDFKETDFDSNFRDEIIRGEVTGFRFEKTEGGHHAWVEQLANHLEGNSRAQTLRLFAQTNLSLEFLEIIDPYNTDALVQLAQARPELVTSAMLQPLIDTLNNQQADGINIRSTSDALVQLAQARPDLVTSEIFQPLIDILTNPKADIYIRSSASDALARLAQARPDLVTSEMFQPLIDILTNPQDYYYDDQYFDKDYTLRPSATYALGQLARAKPEIVTTEMFESLSNILNVADPSFDRDIYSAAADALNHLAQARPELVDPETFQKLFHFHIFPDELSDYDATQTAADALGQLALARPDLVTPAMFQTLIGNLTNPDTTRYLTSVIAVPYFLGQLARARPDLVTSTMFQTLIGTLANQANYEDDVRSSAADALGQLAQAKRQLITFEMFQSLIDILTTPESTTHTVGLPSSAAYALGQLAQARPEFVTPEMFQRLIDVLSEPNDPEAYDIDNVFMRSSAADALGQLAQAKPKLVTPEMFQSLLDILNNRPAFYDALPSTSYALGQLAQARPEFVTSEMFSLLIDLLTHADNTDSLEFSTASALTKLAKVRSDLVDPEMFQPLIDILNDQQFEYPKRFFIAYIIGQLAHDRPELVSTGILQSLIDMITQEAYYYDLISSDKLFPTIWSLKNWVHARPELASSKMFQTLIDILTYQYQQAYDYAHYAPSPASYAFTQVAQARPEFITPEMFQSLFDFLIVADLVFDQQWCSAAGAFDQLAQGRSELVTSKMFQPLIDNITEHHDFEVICSTVPPLTQVSRAKPELVEQDIIPSLIALLKSDLDSAGRKTAAYALFEIALGNDEYENIIRKQLQDMQNDRKPHWRIAASRTLEMITIGGLAEEARSNPKRIEGIKSRLNYLIGLDNSFHEDHLKFAAEIVLREVEKIEAENK
ncbi:MAG TPA: ATP-binding protein [Anaerolineales bacterium]|nr:ATP-binding protein [Anaerolineales bacterium]